MRIGKLKIAIVAPSLRILGGQAVQADGLLRAWRNDPDVEAWLVPVNPVPPRPFRALASIKYVRTVLTELTYLPLLIRELARADVVHVFSAAYTSFLLAPLPAILVAKALGKPVVLNYHSGEAPDHLRRSPVARAALKRVARNVVQSRFLQQVFSTFGLEAAIVPNTIDFDRFRFRSRETFAPRLLSTRNLEPMYNVACTIRAFRIIQDRYPAATLTLAGFGSEADSLRALVRDLKLTGVIFAGRVSPDDIARLYDAADLFVQTPNIDNMPLSVLEAFAAGLPVVSTEAGGVPAILRHGTDGLLAPLNDHRAVASHVLRLLGDQPLAGQLARSAFESCRPYSWNTVREQWLGVYRNAAADAPAPVAATPRVVVFMTSFDPGGTERQMTELIRRLHREHVEVHVACTHRRGAWLHRIEGAAASIAEFPIRSFWHPTTARQLLAFARWCRQLAPVALHCTDFYSNVFGLAGGALAAVPLRIGSRRDINPGRSATRIALQRAAYALAHVVVANSQAAVARLRQERVPARKVLLIANGIDVARMAARTHRASITRVIVVANLRPEKAHAVLIDAAPSLLQRHPHLRFSIVGDGQLRAALEQQAARLDVTHAFEFLGHREDVPQLLADSDVFVLPSRSEACPNAVIEAMAAGLPVVACAVGGNLEVVRHGRTGYLVPPDDAAAMGDAIDLLVSDPARANAMGAEGRDLVCASYGYDRMVAAFEALYTTADPAPNDRPQPELAA
jgi:glycosyltransferase involved in cell wall biosynthesis